MQGRKLTADEVQAIESKEVRKHGVRSALAAEYDQLVAGYESGEYGEVTLNTGENKLTVRKHINAAFKRRDQAVTWNRAKGDTLRFRVA